VTGTEEALAGMAPGTQPITVFAARRPPTAVVRPPRLPCLRDVSFLEPIVIARRP
jgi:hypothetical protein